MRTIKLLGLAALSALMAMALLGASSAMAESTQLCTNDPGGAACTSPVTAIHEVSYNKAVLKTNILTVECDVLFASTSVGALGTPQIIEGHFTYSNCGSCEVNEVSAHATIEVLRLGHELADVTGSGKVLVKCGKFIHCVYNGVGLKGHALGPLLSTKGNGEVTIEGANTEKESGTLCPATSELSLLTEPLTATYIAK